MAKSSKQGLGFALVEGWRFGEFQGCPEGILNVYFLSSMLKA